MANETNIAAIQNLIQALLQGTPDVFLVNIRIKPTNNYKIFIDADGGLDIDRCIKINRALYKQIEELAWYPDGDFSLEVSSPGVDEPLKLLRQYKKNIGRNVEVTFIDGAKQEGKLTVVTNEAITIEYTQGKNKKAELVNKEIELLTIKQTIVLIAF